MEINTHWDGALSDELIDTSALEIESIWQGKVVRVQRESFSIFGIPTVREIVAHPGAVGVIAVNLHGEVALIRQYRHPVRSFLFEPIAGLLDKDEETPLEAAKRELIEEAGLLSDKWSHLIDLIVSPGGSTEIIRFFLAENASPASGGREWSFESEEKEMPLVWVTESEFKLAVLEDRIHNSIAISAIFTAFEVLKTSQRTNLNKPWTLFDALAESGGIGRFPLNLSQRGGKS